MIELGELEKRHEDFAKRNVRVFVIANDDQETSAATQADFPHLFVVSDPKQEVAKAVQVLHPKASDLGEDTNAPTTFLVDASGKVRWLDRPGQVIARFSPDVVLAAIDEHLPQTGS